MTYGKYDIIIIGAGASGMAAASAALTRNPSLHILLLEKKEVPGKKLSAAGNGRCNITNKACPDYPDTEKFLRENGIYLREEEEGRMYPYSGRGGQVTASFTRKIQRMGAEILCGETVLAVETVPGGGFSAETASGHSFLSKILILACGGKAAPQYGTSGDGFVWAKKLGHRVSRLAPVLTPLVLERYPGKVLHGVRAKADAVILKNGKPLAAERGEIQFTEEGISGIAVFNLSRYVKLESGENPREGMRKYEIQLDFFPELTVSDLVSLLTERAADGIRKGELLCTLTDDRLAEAVLRSMGEEDFSLTQMASCLKEFRFRVSNTGGWKAAQCTAGGVLLSEVHPETFASERHCGLYFAGEILDYDGPCGGYNLNHAWRTGRKAGSAAAELLCIESAESEQQ